MMRRIIIVALSAALLTTTAWVVHGAAAGSTGTAGAATPAAAGTGAPTDERALERGVRTIKPASLASQLATARLATARYATSLPAAKAAGYQILTRMIPDRGWHFLNPTIQGFDVTKPPHPGLRTPPTKLAAGRVRGRDPSWNGLGSRPQPCDWREAGRLQLAPVNVSSPANPRVQPDRSTGSCLE
jgi:hypothetical protein